MSSYIETVSVLLADQVSEYCHSFGGPIQHEGAAFEGSDRPLHLLFSLDLEDPRLGISLPHGTTLPLYFPLAFEGASLTYRIISDEEIEILNEESPEYTPGWPSDETPVAFDFRAVEVMPLAADEVDLLAEANRLNDDEGVDPLGEDSLLSEEEKQFLVGLGYPFYTQFGGRMEVIQGVEEEVCQDPECMDEPLVPLAAIWSEGIPGVSLWGEYGTYVQIIFKLCPQCGTVIAESQSD